MTAVHGLGKLMNRQENIDGLRTFLERFRVRIVEMAVAEIDFSVRKTVISSLLSPLYRCV
jgi:hypothetical protein